VAEARGPRVTPAQREDRRGAARILATMSDRERGPDEAPEVEAEQVEQAVVDVAQTPGVDELTGLVGLDREPDLDAIVALFHQHPAERDALMATVHRLLGNTVAAQIAAALAPQAAVEAAAVDESAGREAPIEVAPDEAGTLEVAADTEGVDVAPTAAPEPGTTTEQAAADMREGGISAVTEAPGVEERLGETASEPVAEPIPEPPKGLLKVGDDEIAVTAADQLVLEAAAMVKDGQLLVDIELETFRDQIAALPLSDQGKQELVGAYAEMAAGVPTEEVVAEVDPEEIREPL
jgi:hypothetical protein